MSNMDVCIPPSHLKTTFNVMVASDTVIPVMICADGDEGYDGDNGDDSY